MATTSEVLENIINNLSAADVPPRYIVKAKLTDFQGVEHIFRGEELIHVLKYPELYHMADARIILDARKIKSDILAEVNAIYDGVNRALSEHRDAAKRLPPPSDIF